MKVKRNRKKPFRKKRPIIQKIILDNWVRIPFPFELETDIKNAFTILNPEYLSICRRRGLKKDEWPKGAIVTKEKINGFWKSRRIPQWLFYFKYEKELLVPRGAFQIIREIFKKCSLPYKVINNRVPLKPSTPFIFKGELRAAKGQIPFKDYSAKNGILQSGTGTGKTVMACYHIARKQLKSLIIVDTKELMFQWQSRVKTFLDFNPGLFGDGKKEIKDITIGIINSLQLNPDTIKNFGMVIVDECHVAAIDRYTEVISNFPGTDVLGLSATPSRKDGKTVVMKWYLGDIALKLKRSNAEVLPAKGIFINTPYQGQISFKKQYAVALRDMLEDEERNKLIIKTVTDNIDIYGIHLIISNSSKHLERLLDLLPHHYQLVSRLLVGQVPTKQRKQIVQDAMKNRLKFLFATDKILEKGFDEPLLSVLHIPYPVADPNKIEQACGRVTRVPENSEVREQKRKALIFYYFDWKEESLRNAAANVSRTFTKLKIQKTVVKN